VFARFYACVVPRSLASGSSPTGRGHARLDDTLEFAVSVRAHDPDTVLIAVRGDADLHVASRLEDTLMAAVSTSPTRVVVDLTDVTLFDSSAIHALLVGWSAADGGETLHTFVWLPKREHRGKRVRSAARRILFERHAAPIEVREKWSVLVGHPERAVAHHAKSFAVHAVRIEWKGRSVESLRHLAGRTAACGAHG